VIIIRIDKITIAVENVVPTTDFYSKTFDIDLQEIDCGNFSMYVGMMADIQLLFCPKAIAGVTANESTIQLRFVVADIECTITSCIESGGEVIDELHIENKTKTVALRDPDGNSIEVVQLI
jgi:predicted enzyme related to lactoylglutathione lyase